MHLESTKMFLLLQCNIPGVGDCLFNLKYTYNITTVTIERYKDQCTLVSVH